MVSTVPSYLLFVHAEAPPAEPRRELFALHEMLGDPRDKQGLGEPSEGRREAWAGHLTTGTAAKRRVGRGKGENS